MIDPKQLKLLIKLMVQNDLTEVDLQDPEGERIKIKRGRGEPMVQYVAAGGMAPMAAPSPGHAPSAPAPAHAPSAGEPAAASTAGLIEIKSPMVGTFYAASSPDADPFVKVGASVGPTTVVCLIEAMKVYNEIKAETSGTIERVLVESGQAVEFGQPLFLVKP